MDVDNEVLIALVFDKPALWDTRNKNHSNRNVIDKCWKEISLEMKRDENKIRKRWRYLRDQFAVELGKIPPSRYRDEAITACPKWTHFKPLLFLKQVVKARATTGSLTRRRSPSTSADPDAEIGDTQSTNDNDFSPLPSPRNTEDGDESDQSRVSSKRRRKSLNDKILGKSRQNRAGADNEHLLFFKSLLPHVEKIPQHMLLSFRNRIHSVVEEFAYPSLLYDNPSSSMTNYSHLCNVSISNRVAKEEYDESTVCADTE